MKIIHCADLHLDSKMETNLTATQASERRYEILASFEEMIEYGKEQGVKVILIAGDMFDTHQHIQKSIKKRALEAIINAPQIDFLYLQGNHDNGQYFQQLGVKPNNLKFFGNHWTSYEYGPVVITGVQLGRYNEPTLYDSLEVYPQKLNIVSLHGQVVEGGQKLKPDDINLSLLRGKGIDYLALGHIHTYQCEPLDAHGVYCYSGCLEGRGYDECGPKGFVLLNIERGKIFHQFIATSKRQIHEIEVDITGLDDRELLIKALQSVRDIPAKDYVKLILMGEVSEEIEVDMLYLEKKLGENYYSFKLEDKTQLLIDYTKYANDISLKGEFIRIVQSLEIADTDKKRVILSGLQALRGGE